MMLAYAPARWLTQVGVHYGWVMIALTFLASLCSSAAVTLPAVLILPVSREFGWSQGEVASAIGLMLVLFAVTAPFAGAIILRCGLRSTVAASAALAVASLLGTVCVAARWQLWISFGALGISTGMVAITLSAAVSSRWFVHRRGLAMGVLSAAFAVGQLTFLPLAAWLVADHGWRLAVLPSVIGCAAAALLYILFARDWPSELGLAPLGESKVLPTPAQSDAHSVITLSFQVLGEATRTRNFWILAGTFFICGLSSNGIVTQHFIPFCADNGVGVTAAASALAAMGAFNFVGTITSGWLSDRFDCRMLLAWYYGLRGASLIWLPFSGFDLVALSIFAIFFGLDYVATVPPTVKLTARHFDVGKAPIVFGWAFAAHQIGAAVSAAAAGWSRDAFATYAPAYLAVGLVCMAAAAAIWTIRDAGTFALAVRST